MQALQSIFSFEPKSFSSKFADMKSDVAFRAVNSFPFELSQLQCTVKKIYSLILLRLLLIAIWQLVKENNNH